MVWYLVHTKSSEPIECRLVKNQIVRAVGCCEAEGEGDGPGRELKSTCDEERVVRVACRMVLRLEQGIEIPEAAFHISVRWHL